MSVGTELPEVDQNVNDSDWWIDAVEIDTTQTMALSGEGGLWESSFVPPPPRPEFLDEHISTDGVTTCDLCTWAWHHPYSPETLHGREHVNWVMTLVIVSLLSALIGAIVMVTLIRCRNRFKHLGHATGCLCLQRDQEIEQAPSLHLTSRSASRTSSKDLGTNYHSPSSNNNHHLHHHHSHHHTSSPTTNGEDKRHQHRVWSWLSRRQAPPPTQLESPPQSAPDNHYTLEENYPPNEEALYAELDRDSASSPAYQNTAYTGSDVDPECLPSSPPSSAYYSDLSCTPSDRTYEAVGPPEPSVTFWDSRRPPQQIRLSCINETNSVPSDYI